MYRPDIGHRQTADAIKKLFRQGATSEDHRMKCVNTIFVTRQKTRSVYLSHENTQTKLNYAEIAAKPPA